MPRLLQINQTRNFNDAAPQLTTRCLASRRITAQPSFELQNKDKKRTTKATRKVGSEESPAFASPALKAKKQAKRKPL